MDPFNGYTAVVSEKFELGATQLVQVLPDTYVVNMIGQEGTKTGSKGPPIRYPAIEKALFSVARFANQLGATVHGPRFGAGLAGGRWSVIESLIEKCLFHVPVYI